MNAKQEFLEHIKNKKVVCARIGIERNYGKKDWFILKDNYSEKEFEEFCNNLDFGYDSGFGGQELYGMILFENSYSDRGEYDGSEWWENHKMPTIKQVLAN
jgi:hypothetical protein